LPHFKIVKEIILQSEPNCAIIETEQKFSF